MCQQWRRLRSVVRGTSSNDQECNSLIGGAAKDGAENFDARGWRYLQSQCNQFTKQKGNCNDIDLIQRN